MNRWARNYYTKQPGKDQTPQRKHSHTSISSATPSRRGSIGKGIGGDEGVVNVCVYKVVHLTQRTLKSLIERQGVEVMNVEQVCEKGTSYKSFVVTVKEKDAQRLLDKSFWPGLVGCRLLKDVDPWHIDMFNRYTREPPLPANYSDIARQRISRLGEGTDSVTVGTAKTFQVKPSNPSDIDNIDGTKGNSKEGQQNINKTKAKTNKGNPKNDKEAKKPNTTQDSSRKSSVVDEKPKGGAGKWSKTAKVPTKTNMIKVKQRSNDNNTSQEHGANTAHPRTYSAGGRVRKHHTALTGKSRKAKSSSGGSMKNSKSEGTSDDDVVEGRPKDKPSRRSVPPSIMSSHYMIPSTKNYKDDTEDYPHVSKSTQKTRGKSKWTVQLKNLLKKSPEEALNKLLGPEYDQLLIHQEVTDEELFLGVKALAHCARAEGSQDKQKRLVHRIFQPQVVFHLKIFMRTVEERYKQKAERFFWDLGEFLDMYIVNNIFIHGVLSLLTVCLSKILALNYRRYVSDDLVKVYRGMQTQAFKNLP